MKILDVEVVKDSGMGKCYVVSVCNDKDETVAKKYVILKPHFDSKNRINANVDTKDGWMKLFEWKRRDPYYTGREEYIRALASFVIEFQRGQFKRANDFRFRKPGDDANEVDIFQRLTR